MHSLAPAPRRLLPLSALPILALALLAGSGAATSARASASPSAAPLAQPAGESPGAIHLPFLLRSQSRAELPRPVSPPAPDPTRPRPVPSPTAFASPGPLVRTGAGPVLGQSLGASLSWLGIPYAAPPVGALRWQPPRVPIPWAEPLAALAHGPICPQYEDDALVGDEDCLTLNVWAPSAAAAPRPVMVFVHGGGHVQGSSAVRIGQDLLYDGRSLAEDHGVVLVTINYRLGPFGFLAHPDLAAEREGPGSGNYGMLDQIAALQWVQANIAGFGGDPERVMIFGQSAGAVSVCRLIASPLARGLFQRAALHSGACVATPRDVAEAQGLEVARALGCQGTPSPTACMRQAPTAQVMATFQPDQDTVIRLGRNAYDGVIDGLALPAAPLELIARGRHQPVPTLIGTTSAETAREAPELADEAAYEAAVRAYLAAAGLPQGLSPRVLAAYPASSYPNPRAAFVALTSDLKFVCTSRRAAQTLSLSQSQPVFQYSFEHVADKSLPALRAQGAAHSTDLPYLFGVLSFQTRLGRYEPGPGDIAVSEAMMTYWTRFAATGDPNLAAPDAVPLPAWPTYDAADQPYLRLLPPPAPSTALRATQCEFWESLRP